ncbi:MAG: HAD family hydrolase [Beijerinckiaceae bacterium]
MTSASRGALLFDIDGTLADTDPLHIRAFNAMLSAFGMNIGHEEYTRRVMGFTNAEIMRGFFPDMSVDGHRRLADEKEATFRRLAATEMTPTPGLLGLMDWADAHGVPMAAVTNAPRANAELMLSGLGITHRFRTVVIGDELPRGKPDPLPYLVAGERLGIACGQCIAFEDSRSGMRSASGSGALSVGVLSSLPEAELVAAGAQFAVKDFTDPRLIPLAHERLLGARV